MHCEYAWAFSRGVVGREEVSLVWATVVVGLAAMVGTVGDLDPPEQAATPTETTTAAAGQSFDERNLRAGSLEVMLQSRQPRCCQPVRGFRYASDMRQLVSLGACAC
jgi:hypothetical protein